MPKEASIRSFDYSDIIFVPKKAAVSSRSEVDTSVEFGGRKFKLPVVPANMSTIVDTELAKWLASNDYFYVMHRFDVDNISFVEDMQSKGLIASISVGVKDKDYSEIKELSAKGLAPEYITIDIAHGHADSVINMIEHIKTELPDTFIIAGNVGSVEGALELERAGADAVKIGIAPGAACLTGPNTGFGTRGYQLSAVEAIANVVNVPVIADGGIREYGDIAKAVAFGASMVMIGGMFAGHDENPGEVFENEKGEKFKVFYGSASEHQKGENKHVEGKKLTVPYKGSVGTTLTTIKENLQSSVSYAGGKDLSSLDNVEYVILKNNL